jgi:hypothetical protein
VRGSVSADPTLNRSAGLGYSPDPARGIGLYSGAGDVIESNTVTGGDTGVYVYDGVGAINGETDGSAQATALLDDNALANVSLAGTTYDGSVTVGDTVYPSVAAAEDAAEPGETIELAPGTYDEQVIVETEDLTISGAGADATTIAGAIGLDADGTTVEGLTVETTEGIGEEELEGASERRPAPSAISVGGTDDHTIRNVVIVGPGKSATTSAGESVVGISFDDGASTLPTGTTVETVEISDVKTGVWAGGDDLTIRNATISDTVAGIGGVEAGTVTVADSEFTNTFEAVGVGPGSVDLSGQTGLAGAPVGGYTAYHTSIQQTVDRAEAGSTVEVLPGTYEEGVGIGKELTLAGMGPNETTITTDEGPTVLIEGHTPDSGDSVGSVTLQDFSVVAGSDESGIATYSETAETDYDTKSLTVENVHVNGTDGYGVTLTSTAEATLSDVSVSGVESDSAGAVEAVGVGDLTITDSRISESRVGVDVSTVDRYGAVDSVSFSGLTFEENDIDVRDTTGAVKAPAEAATVVTATDFAAYFDSRTDAEAFVSAQDAPDAFLIRSLDDESDDGDEADSGETYTVAPGQSVSATVDKVETGSTIVVDKETVDESITLSKSVSLVAGEVSSGGASISAATTGDSTSRPTITDTVSISNYADDVTVEGFAFDLDAGGGINANRAGDDLTIRNNTFSGGSSDDGVPAAVRHGGVGSGQGDAGARSGWVVADNEFSDIDGQALRLWNLQSVTVEDNEFSELTYSAVSHRGVTDTEIRNNSFTEIDRAGVFVDTADSVSPLGAQDVTVENNSFENVGASDLEYDQGGVNVSANVADLSEITVRGNDFESGQFGIHVADDAQDATGSIQASFNYWNASSGPSGVAGGEGVPVTAGVTASPSLPDPTSEYEDVREVTGGTYSVTVPADGEPRVVAFPADVEGTAGEVFGNFSGNVFAYDAASGSWDRVEDANREVDALDAFVVVPDENASDLTISYTLASSATDEPSVPPEADLDAGWNLVGAPQFGAADEAFGASTADPARVLKTYRGPTGEPFAPGFESTTGVVGDTDTVSPFEGYWVYATEDGTLAGNAPPGTDASDLEDLLKEA